MQVQQNKKKIILAVLLVFLAGYWIFSLIAKGAGNHAPGSGAAAAKKVRLGPPKMAIRVDMGSLERRRPGYTASRNIFSPVYKKPELVKPPVPSPAKQAGPVTVTPLPPLPPPPPPKPQAEIDAENAREELKKIQVLGFLKRKGRTDVFMSLGNEKYVAGRGEKITKGYYVADIGKDFVVLSDKSTGVEVKVSTVASKEGSKTVPSPGVPGGPAGKYSPPVQYPGAGGMPPGMPGMVEVGKPGPNTPPATPNAPPAARQPEPLKNYSVR